MITRVFDFPVSLLLGVLMGTLITGALLGPSAGAGSGVCGACLLLGHAIGVRDR